jgi:hypothetical protein
MVTMAVYQTNDGKTKHGNIIMMGYFAVSCIPGVSQPGCVRRQHLTFTQDVLENVTYARAYNAEHQETG